MKIGELVERLISLRDRHKHEWTREEDQEVCAIINLADRLPRNEEADEYGKK